MPWVCMCYIIILPLLLGYILIPYKIVYSESRYSPLSGKYFVCLNVIMFLSNIKRTQKTGLYHLGLHMYSVVFTYDWWNCLGIHVSSCILILKLCMHNCALIPLHINSLKINYLVIRKSDIWVIEKTRKEWEENKGEEKKEYGLGWDGKRNVGRSEGREMDDRRREDKR